MPVAYDVLRHAADSPERVAVRGPYGSLTYAELAEKVQGGARHLKGRGALVAIAMQDPVELLAAVLAADLAGATPLVGEHTWGPARWTRATEAAGADLQVTEPLPYATGPRLVPAPGPRDRAWACFTSGSTGGPRAVVRTRASWTRSFPHLDDLTGIGRGDAVLVPGPLSSSLYGFAAVHTLAAGATALLPGHRAPAAFVRAATAIHLVPHRLAAVLPDARSLRTAVVGGAALAPDVRETATRAGVRVVSYYGATELSFVTWDGDGSGMRAFPGVQIEVRAEQGRALGEVWARSPWLAEGYLGGAAGPLRRDGDGWMTVGDLAEPYRPGQVLRVRGRGDGAIQTGGATVVPEDVEAVLRKVPGVGDIVVIGSPHPSLGSVVTAVVEGSSPPPRALLEAVARAGLDAAQRPRRWYAVPALPRTGSGKPARGLIADRLAGGDPDLVRLA